VLGWVAGRVICIVQQGLKDSGVDEILKNLLNLDASFVP
jgi:hypothetical protein